MFCFSVVIKKTKVHSKANQAKRNYLFESRSLWELKLKASKLP